MVGPSLDIEQMAEELFNPKDEFISGLHTIAIDIAGVTKEQWIAETKERLGIVDYNKPILINPVFGDFIKLK